MQYRFGAKNNLELVYPHDKIAPTGKFSSRFESYSDSATHIFLEFSIGHYKYELFQFAHYGCSEEQMSNDPEEYCGEHAGLNIYKNKTLAKEVKCDVEKSIYKLNGIKLAND